MIDNTLKLLLMTASVEHVKEEKTERDRVKETDRDRQTDRQTETERGRKEVRSLCDSGPCPLKDLVSNVAISMWATFGSLISYRRLHLWKSPVQKN